MPRRSHSKIVHIINSTALRYWLYMMEFIANSFSSLINYSSSGSYSLCEPLDVVGVELSA